MGMDEEQEQEDEEEILRNLERVTRFPTRQALGEGV